MSIFDKQALYVYNQNKFRFLPFRSNYCIRKKLDLIPSQCKYPWVIPVCSFSNKQDVRRYTILNKSFIQLLNQYKRKDIQLSHSKADWNMDLILCTKKRYKRFYEYDKLLYTIKEIKKEYFIIKI